MQKKTKIISIIVAVLVFITIGIFISRVQHPIIITNAQFQDKLSQLTDVKIFIDKNSYFSNEKVKITIQNNYDEPIYIPGAFIVSKIYKQDRDNWLILDSYCDYPHCVHRLPGLEEIKSGESKEVEWNPVYFVRSDSKLLKAGEYVVSINFGLNSSKGKDWKVAYSESFLIRRSFAQIFLDFVQSVMFTFNE